MCIFIITKYLLHFIINKYLNIDNYHILYLDISIYRVSRDSYMNGSECFKLILFILLDINIIS